MFQLVVGTGNIHKIRELQAALPPGRFELIPLSRFPEAIEVDETGSTFAENARLKATVQAKHLGRWVLAEDSGLQIDALDGRPGVRSARYAGRHGDDQANNRLVLEQMQDVPAADRGAAFCCFMCVASPDGQAVIEVNAACRGVIATAAAGSGGFGYDPLFIIPEYHLTFAELGLAVKNVLSHRSRALRKLLPPLLNLTRTETP